jgi:hypothetical protein
LYRELSLKKAADRDAEFGAGAGGGVIARPDGRRLLLVCRARVSFPIGNFRQKTVAYQTGFLECSSKAQVLGGSKLPGAPAG